MELKKIIGTIFLAFLFLGSARAAEQADLREQLDEINRKKTIARKKLRNMKVKHARKETQMRAQKEAEKNKKKLKKRKCVCCQNIEKREKDIAAHGYVRQIRKKNIKESAIEKDKKNRERFKGRRDRRNTNRGARKECRRRQAKKYRMRDCVCARTCIDVFGESEECVCNCKHCRRARAGNGDCSGAGWSKRAKRKAARDEQVGKYKEKRAKIKKTKTQRRKLQKKDKKDKRRARKQERFNNRKEVLESARELEVYDTQKI